MKLSRRIFIKTAPSYGLVPFLASGLSACDNDNNTSLNAPTSRSQAESTDYHWLPRETIFQHGIASGDPQSNRVILWTRINPISTSLENGIQVEYQISKNKNFSTIEKSESMMTNGHRDFSVKFDVDDLEEYQTYYYRFIYRHQNTYSISEVGRTKTLPHTHIDQIKIAMTSCSHYGYGYFNVYDRIADMKDIDVVLHLGDYLYEYGNDDAYRNPLLWNRIVLPNHEMITLDDYRLRHATYKTDRDLQRLHRTHPMIAIWDDHEFTDNAWRNGAENHDSSEGDWQVRSSAAIQAYYEWMPIREPVGYDSHTTVREKSYRQFRFGNLMNLCMIDTRYIGRDQQLSFDNPELYSDSRTLLGKEQEQWLEEQLIAAQNEGVRWKLIGQQVQMMQLKLPGPPLDLQTNYVNNDSWDGYPKARQRLLEHISHKNIDNTIFLTGDVHSSWAAAIAPQPYDIFSFNPITQDGAVAVELVTPSVTSPTIPIPGLQQLVGDIAFLVPLFNPHVRYIDIKNRGFVKLTINHQEVKADWYHVPIVGFRNRLIKKNHSVKIESGIPKIQEI